MGNAVWFEIQGDSTEYPNAESVRVAAIKRAKSSAGLVEVYRCTRTLVRTVQRSDSVIETDIPPA